MLKKEKKSVREAKIFNNLVFSHQLTPALTAMKWSLKMLCDGHFGEINEQQKDIIEKIIKKNESLISLVNKLLSASKLSDGKYFYNQKLAGVENIIESVIENSQEDAAKKNIKIEFKKPTESLPKIMTDKEMMQMAIQNIFDNAIKYTRANGNIKVFLKLNKKDIELGVKDSGIGIPAKQKDKLFKKFSRGDNAVKINAAGSGIGLFIVKNIIKAHKGKIWFESEENKGSTFYISLPI